MTYSRLDDDAREDAVAESGVRMAEVSHADVDKSAQDTTDASLTPTLDRYSWRTAFACFGLTFGAHRSEPQATSDDDLGEECQICMDQARGCGLTLRSPQSRTLSAIRLRR